MNLLDLAIKITCDDQASGQIEQLSAGAMAKAVVVGNAVYDIAKAVGSAAVDMGRQALASYSNYEQLVGGVDKLYGAASQKLQAYAAQAYETSGMSANQYMEQATSFSAALVSSLGGDVSKAADQTDVAMRSIADNVNVFGSNMEDVQNAYQGFAKANYTMLDNLKLGYGGTKSEMERLIADANEYAAATGRASDLSIDSFSDIVTAIDLIQEKQGIMGTTANEAAQTIEGSINMAKAAWANWVTGLGSDTADMQELSGQLLESIGHVVDNVGPRVGQIVGTFVGTVVAQGPEIAAQVGGALGEALFDAFDIAGTFITDKFELPLPNWEDTGILQFLGDVQAFAQRAGEGLSELAGDFDFAGAVEVVSTALQLFGGFLDGVSAQAGEYLMPALQNLGEQLGLLGGAFVDAQVWVQPLADVLGNVLVAAGILLVDTFTLIVGVVRTIIEGITGFVNAIVEAPANVQAFVDQVGAFFAQLPELIGGYLSWAIQSVVSWAAAMWTSATQAGSQFVQGIGSFLSGLPGNVLSWLTGVISTVAGWVGNFATNATAAASQFGSSLRDGLASIPGTLGQIGSNIIQGLINGVTGAAGRLVDSVKGAVGDAIQGAKNLLGIHSPSKVFRQFGVYTMQGMQLGIEGAADLPVKAARDAMAAVADIGPVNVAANVSQQAGVGDAVTAWLADNLGDIIAEYTPYVGQRDFDRMARRAVRYA